MHVVSTENLHMTGQAELMIQHPGSKREQLGCWVNLKSQSLIIVANQITGDNGLTIPQVATAYKAFTWE